MNYINALIDGRALPRLCKPMSQARGLSALLEMEAHLYQERRVASKTAVIFTASL